MGPKCKVLGCKSGYLSTTIRNKKLKLKNPSLFRAPKDPDLFEKWKNRIPVRSELTKNNVICELHFHPDDIERYYITNLPDGSCCKIERGVPKLKEGIVPHIFSNLKGQLPNTSTLTTESFSGILSDTVCNIKEEPVSNDESVNSNCLSGFQKENETFIGLSSDKVCSINEQPATNDKIVNTNCLSRFLKENEAFNPISYDTAYNINQQPVTKNNIGLIQLPDEWWGINSTPQFIICTKWKDNYSSERRVIIEDDSRVKIFIKNHEVPTDETLRISSIRDISRLLCEVNAYKICAGIDDNSMTNCLMYEKESRHHGRFSVWCKNCRPAKQLLYQKQQNHKRCEIKKFKRNKCFACTLTKACLHNRNNEKSSLNTSLEPSVDASIIEPSVDASIIEPSVDASIIEPSVDAAVNHYIVLAECLISEK